jgi:hypothetical protein
MDYTAAAIPYQAQHTTCSEMRLRTTAGPLHDFFGYSTASRKRVTNCVKATFTATWRQQNAWLSVCAPTSEVAMLVTSCIKHINVSQCVINITGAGRGRGVRERATQVNGTWRPFRKQNTWTKSARKKNTKHAKPSHWHTIKPLRKWEPKEYRDTASGGPETKEWIIQSSACAISSPSANITKRYLRN